MSIYLLLGLYILIVIGLSYYYSDNSSAEAYLISNRDRNSFHILASKFAGAVGVSTFITYTGYAYRFGAIGVAALMLGILIGYNLFAFWAAPKIKELSLAHKFYTQGDLVSHVTKDQQIGKFTNIVTVVIQFFWILLSLVGGAKVIDLFGILPYAPALLLTATVILVYILLSGLKAVIITDVIQTFIILILLALLVYHLLHQNTYEFSELLNIEPPERLKGGSVIGLLLYGALSVFGLADRYQLCYAAKDINTAKRGMSLAVIPIIIIGGLLLFVGLSTLAQDSSLNHDDAFIYAMQHLITPEYTPILLVLFFAGLMSSADTNIFAVASHTSVHQQKANILTTRKHIVIVIVLATIIAFFWQDIINITLVGAALRLTLAVPMIYVLRGGDNHYRFLGATIGGITALIIGVATVGITPLLALLVLVGTLLGLLYKGRKD